MKKKKKKQLKKTINNVVIYSLERMKVLRPDDRFHLFLEIGEWIFNDINLDNEFMVPRQKNQLKSNPIDSYVSNKIDDINSNH